MSFASFPPTNLAAQCVFTAEIDVQKHFTASTLWGNAPEAVAVGFSACSFNISDKLTAKQGDLPARH